METFHLIADSKGNYCFCPECGLKIIKVNPKDYPFGQINGLCTLCYAKKKKWYKTAKKQLYKGFSSNETWYGKCPFASVGWSFVEKIWVTDTFLSILKCSSLNKIPKTHTTLSDYFSKWAMKIADNY